MMHLQIECQEPFRLFAPSVLRERVREYSELALGRPDMGWSLRGTPSDAWL